MDALFGGHDKKSDDNKSDDKKSDTTSHTAGSKPSDHHKPSNSELLASAKVVADAAMGKEKVDKGKVAGAAEDLLEAAEEYGKLGDTSYGKYVDKAEEYLHKYRDTTGHDPPKAGDAKPAAESGKEGKADEKEGGGMGDQVMKMAGGFFK